MGAGSAGTTHAHASGCSGVRCGVRCALHPVDLTGISPCDVCSCHEMLTAQRTRVVGPPRRALGQP
jgi:hypothetical protein